MPVAPTATTTQRNLGRQAPSVLDRFEDPQRPIDLGRIAPGQKVEEEGFEPSVPLTKMGYRFGDRLLSSL
jgi:hypothetical protein